MTIDILKTLQYMKPDIKALVWQNDIDQIEYNETETFQPTKDEILAIDQSLVTDYWNKKDSEDKKITLQSIQDQIAVLSHQLNTLNVG